MSRFTNSEDSIIQLLYPRGQKEEILQLLPNRSWRNILERARRLGVERDLSYIHAFQRQKESDWTAAEDTTLKQLYSSANTELIQLKIPNRSWAAIKIRANKLGLVFEEKVDLTNKIFNFWKILHEDGLRVECLCVGCDKITKVLDKYDVVHGRTKSCGCQRNKLTEKANLKNFGVKYYTQTPEYQSRRKQTTLQKYGVDHNFKVEESKPTIRQKARLTMKERYGVEYSAKIEKNRLKLKNWCESNPEKLYKSNAELEILEWIKTFYPNAKKFKKQGHEIDVFIPELNLGIEHNGLYRHNELHKTKTYHLDKTNFFKQENIRIIHIFEHEWKHKQAQVKSFLLSAIGKNQHRVGARDCEFIWKDATIDREIICEFLDTYHIQGRCTYRYAIQILYKGELVGVATFGRHHRNKNAWVLNRFCSKANYTIQGGLAKLSKIASSQLKESIISWAHIRLSNGNGYLQAGWIEEEILPPDYFYHKGLKVYSKQSRQKKKIGTPEGMTEHEHAKLDGLSRVWDCGKIRFIYKYENAYDNKTNT
jgi:hypothetical protein